MQKKQLFFAGGFLCLLVLAWSYYQYQKPRAAAASETTAFTLTAGQLYSDYSSAEDAAQQKYGGRVLAVSGVVAAVQQTPQAINILLAVNGATGGVNCSMATKENSTAVGARITVKGRCAGFLMDVNLVDAVIITD